MIEEARHRRQSIDLRVDEVLREKLGTDTANQEVPTLTIVTTLLDHICVSDPAWLEGRKVMLEARQRRGRGDLVPDQESSTSRCTNH